MGNREILKPAWATGKPTKAVRAALLLTSWDDQVEADRNAVAAMTGGTYTDAREELLALAHSDDPLLALTDHQWHLVSPPDAWLRLGSHLLADDLKAFVETAVAVLSIRDPVMAMAPAERWRAGIDGIKLEHSHSLRKGIATGLAIMGSYGSVLQAGTGAQGETWASRAVRPLLAAANADRSGELWATVAPHLPLLVEAAPRDVLDALRDGVQGPRPVLSTIFQDDRDHQTLFGSSSPHTWFLWALERAAWSSDHLAEVTELLAALADLDPGGSLTNRPSGSLAQIYSERWPQTSADRAERLAIIDRLRERWPEIVWTLMVSMLSSEYGAHFSTAAPDYRDWKQNRSPVLMPDPEAIESIFCRALEDVGTSVDRWPGLLGVHTDLDPGQRGRLRASLLTLPTEVLSSVECQRLADQVRSLTTHQREYADAEWALPAAEIAELEAATARITPSDAIHRHAWLFADHWVTLGDISRRDDHAAYEAEVAQRRADAVAEIADIGGVEGVERFASRAIPGLVGVALADAFRDTYLETMLAWVDQDTPRNAVASSYLWRRSRTDGLAWAVSVLHDRPWLPPTVQARLLHDTGEFRPGWEEVRSRGPEVERCYWQQFSYVGLGGDFPDSLVVAEQLGRVGRWAAALEVLTIYGRSGQADAEYGETVARCLEGYVESEHDDSESGALRPWNFQQLFGALDANAEALGLDRVATIQWRCLPALGFDPPTTTLHIRLASDPAFFVELISLIYRARSDVESETQPESRHDRRAVENARRLLDSWSVPPGSRFEGDFDIDRCRAWVEEASQLLEENDRFEVGRHEIGQVLTYTPPADASWPTQETADLVEELADDRIDAGIYQKIRNRRGITSRGLTEGGGQERGLAATYRDRARRFTISSPRIARILNDIAISYEHDAARWDAEAERRRQGLDI